MSLNLFTTHTYTIQGVNEIEFFPFGDVHYDTSGCDHQRFEEYIRRTKSFDQKKCLYLLMGDALDFSSTSERRKLNAAGLHETTIDRFDRMAKSDVAKFCKEISHMKGHMIGVIDGNHQWTFANGQTSDELISETMQCKSLGWLSYIKIRVITARDNCSTFDIVACHGKAGGKLLGTSINQVDDLRKVFPNADLYCMGHDHKLSSTPCASLYACHNHKSGELEIKQLEQRLIRTGSFKKTYSVGVESYEISKIYQPAILGACRVTMKINRVREGGVDRTYKSLEAHV